MAIPLATWLLLSIPTAATAETGFRVDVESQASWQPMPHWLGNASERASVTAADGRLDFAVPEPGKGMKWRISFQAADVFVYRWLVVEYRLLNYAPEAPDYLVWCDADTGDEGLQLLPPEGPPYDDRSHTVAWDLQRHNAGDGISAIAVQCQAGAAGDAHLLITSIELVDRPPEGAEGEASTVAEERSVEPDILKPELWEHHLDWLANPGDDFGIRRIDGGMRLEVDEPGKGMKWSTELAEPIEGLTWLSVRYRAANIDPRGRDYFLYLASEGGGSAPEEQYCINLGDLEADGEWHVAAAPVTVPSVRSIALQLQAQSGPAYAEIGWLRFSTARPKLTLDDALPFAAADSLQPNERALEIAGPFVPAADAQAALDLSSWFDEPLISVRSVTFELPREDPRVAATPYNDLGKIDVIADGSASEVYLLLGARFARTEEPSYGGGQLRSIVDPHRFVAQVTYEDGTVDEFIPARIPPDGPAREFAVHAGIDAYVVGPLAGKPVQTMALRDGMRRGGFLLAAATANTAEARFCTQRPEETPYEVAEPPRLSRDSGGQHQPGALIGQRAGDLEALVRVTQGLDRAQLTFGPQGLPPLTAEGSLFSVRVGDRTLAMNDFGSAATRKSDVEGGAVWATGRAAVDDARLGCSLLLDADRAGRIALRLELTNEGDAPIEIQPTFPDLPAIAPPDAWGESWYFFPRRGCVINHVPVGLREAYSGAFPFQVESVFWPDAGVGLYLMTRDLDLTFRYWRLSKDSDGVHMSIEYPAVTLGPGETWQSVETVIGANEGDWHGAWQTYRDWLATWYRPAAPRKAWFREVFNFRQQFMHFALPEKSGMFDNETKAYRFEEVVDADIEAFGGVDYLHIFDWGWSQEFGRCGDYDHWEQIGSAQAFAQAIEGVQNREIPVGLYIEGYLVDPPSNYGKAHGEEYQLLDREGNPYPYFAPSYNMCSAVTEWQDYLAGVYKRTRELTGAMGYYVDEMGFADPGHLCHAGHHGHPIPWPPAPGQRDLLGKIREALGREPALYTEESSPDVTSQYQDGSFTYNISSVSDQLSPTHLNLYRFTIPTFKTFEIITCDHPLGSNLQAVKRVFFNGEGLWIEGIADRWFTPETRATIAKTHSILKRYQEAFTSDAPTPLVSTLKGRVYANQFPAGKDLCVWTLYNANPRTVRGAVIRVPHVDDAEYVDAWREEPASVEIEGESALIALTIGPRDVSCIVRMTDAEAAADDRGEEALLVTDGMTADQADQIEALLVGEAIRVERVGQLPVGTPSADLVIVDSRAAGRSAFDFAASMAGRPEDGRPAVALVGHAGDETRAAWQAGADGFFRWPWDADEFRQIAKRLIRERRLNRG